MKCPLCQYENLGSHNFCGECGTPLTHTNGRLQAPSYEDLRLENAQLLKELEAHDRNLAESLEQQTATSEPRGERMGFRAESWRRSVVDES
jgi:uncharacterized Zn finger protein (UPF0148 family)